MIVDSDLKKLQRFLFTNDKMTVDWNVNSKTVYKFNDYGIMGYLPFGNVMTTFDQVPKPLK